MPTLIDLAQFHEYCATAWRPQVLQGFLLNILTQHFSSAETIEDENLKDLIWSAEPSQTKILIDSITRFEPRTTEFRPALQLKMNDQTRIKLGINDQFQGTDLTGERFTNLWAGSHTIYCLAREGAELATLAWEVAKNLNEFAPLLRNWLKLHRLEVAKIGFGTKLEEAKETFTAPILIEYAYEQVWKISEVAPVLTTINTTLF